MTRSHLIATRPLRYRNRALRAGDGFVVTRSEAALYVAVGVATHAPATVATVAKARPAPASPAVARPASSEAIDAAIDELDAARAEYQALSGRTPDRRWGLARIKSEVEFAKAEVRSTPEAEAQAE